MGKYFYQLNGKQTGPLDVDTLKDLVVAGIITRSTMVLPEGSSEWIEAATVKDLFPSTAARPAAGPPPLPKEGTSPVSPPNQAAPRQSVAVPVAQQITPRPAHVQGVESRAGLLALLLAWYSVCAGIIWMVMAAKKKPAATQTSATPNPGNLVKTDSTDVANGCANFS